MNSIFSQIGLTEFLENNPKASLRPSTDGNIYIRGKFLVSATTKKKPQIDDKYDLEIMIPYDFPQNLPLVKEIDNRVNDESSSGHMLKGGYLCLGSPPRLLKIVNHNPTISYFFEKCVIPYLYAISFRERYGGKMVFGELSHGYMGLLEDYLELYDTEQIKSVIYLVNKKKRVANKLLCPCGCNQRLGKCKLHYKINVLRKLKYLYSKK